MRNGSKNTNYVNPLSDLIKVTNTKLVKDCHLLKCASSSLELPPVTGHGKKSLEAYSISQDEQLHRGVKALVHKTFDYTQRQERTKVSFSQFGDTKLLSRSQIKAGQEYKLSRCVFQKDGKMAIAEQIFEFRVSVDGTPVEDHIWLKYRPLRLSDDLKDWFETDTTSWLLLSRRKSNGSVAYPTEAHKIEFLVHGLVWYHWEQAKSLVGKPVYIKPL